MSRLDLRRPRPTAPRAPRVLLVEDDPGDAQHVRDLLGAGWGADVDVVHVETLQAALAHLGEPGLVCVLLDLTLPDTEPLDGLARVRDAAPEIPVVVLSRHADEMLALLALQAGAQDYLVKGRVDDQLVSRALRHAVERKRSAVELRDQAPLDGITELPDRSAFLEHAGPALARTGRTGQRVAVILLGLEGFEGVTESLGRPAADRLLELVAMRLRGVARGADVVAWFGGDEFSVLCDDLVDERDAVVICERMAEAIAAPFAIAGTEVVLTASAGIAVADPAGAEPAALVAEADAAMHRARGRGSSRPELFDEILRVTAVRRLETQPGLHGALERAELRVHYQPKVSLADGHVVALEALVRWQHPERGLLTPASFIGLAEETGLIVPIGRWVLDEACAQLARWREHGPLAMAVNLSARQLAQPHLVDDVADALALHGIDPGELVLELTESLVIADDEDTRSAFAALRALGVRLAIDDFGTGYASLAALRHCPADVLKVDRSFVAGLGRDHVDTAIVSAVVGLAHDLGLTAVAEGVETAEQAAQLRRLDCDLAQGHLFSPAVPAADIDALLATRVAL